MLRGRLLLQVPQEDHWSNAPYHDMRSNTMERMIVVQCDHHSKMLEQVAEACMGGYAGYRSAGLPGGCTPVDGVGTCIPGWISRYCQRLPDPRPEHLGGLCRQGLPRSRITPRCARWDLWRR